MRKRTFTGQHRHAAAQSTHQAVGQHLGVIDLEDGTLGGGFGFLYEPGDKWDFADKVFDIYEGQISISADTVWDGYRNFSDAIVFPDTYNKIKEAGWL